MHASMHARMHVCQRKSIILRKTCTPWGGGVPLPHAPLDVSSGRLVGRLLAALLLPMLPLHLLLLQFPLLPQDVGPKWALARPGYQQDHLGARGAGMGCSGTTNPSTKAGEVAALGPASTCQVARLACARVHACKHGRFSGRVQPQGRGCRQRRQAASLCALLLRAVWLRAMALMALVQPRS